jgi:polar amino acid transport system substrate-binding protein
MKHLSFRLLAAAMFLLVAAPCRAVLPAVINVCDDSAEWPPYTYFERSNGTRTNVLTGFSVEYLRRVMDHAHLRFTIDLIPWQRCMAEVQEGQYAMLLNA